MVAGGADKDAATADEELLQHVRRLAADARRVTSICSGAFLLAAAGLLDGRVEIVEAVVDVNGTMVFGSPKSHQHRSVPIPRFLRADLVTATAGKSRGDLVFPSAMGSVLRMQHFRRDMFDRAALEAGLPGLTPHELRHTAASLATIRRVAPDATWGGIRRAA